MNNLPEMQKVPPSDILAHLTCLSKMRKEKIRCSEKLNGPRQAADELFEEIIKREEWYPTLVKALRKTGYKRQADLLEGPEKLISSASSQSFMQNAPTVHHTHHSSAAQPVSQPRSEPEAGVTKSKEFQETYSSPPTGERQNNREGTGRTEEGEENPCSRRDGSGNQPLPNHGSDPTEPAPSPGPRMQNRDLRSELVEAHRKIPNEYVASRPSGDSSERDGENENQSHHEKTGMPGSSRSQPSGGQVEPNSGSSLTGPRRRIEAQRQILDGFAGGDVGDGDGEIGNQTNRRVSMRQSDVRKVEAPASGSLEKKNERREVSPAGQSLEEIQERDKMSLNVTLPQRTSPRSPTALSTCTPVSAPSPNSNHNESFAPEPLLNDLCPNKNPGPPHFGRGNESNMNNIECDSESQTENEPFFSKPCELNGDDENPADIQALNDLNTATTFMISSDSQGSRANSQEDEEKEGNLPRGSQVTRKSASACSEGESKGVFNWRSYVMNTIADRFLTN